MDPQEQPEISVGQKANWGKAILLSLGLIALLSVGTYINFTQLLLRDSSAADASPRDESTPTPEPTRTFAEWRGEAETIA